MTDPNPDIIEKAAQAALNAGRAYLGLKPSQLSELPPPSAECWRIEARAALEAAAPLIAAQAKAEAWDEGHEAAALRIPGGTWHDMAAPHPGNPYREAGR